MKCASLLPLLLLGAAVGCTTTDNPLVAKPQSVAWNVDPEIPAAVRAPEGHVLLGHVVGKGVAVFTAEADPNRPGRAVWVATRDDGADLLDPDGRVVGHHEDDAWAVTDGSSLIAEPIARLPRDGRLALTLLQTTSHEGGGLLGRAEFVEQLNTVGGPAEPPDPSRIGATVRAEYSADYYFYGPLAAQTRVNRGAP